MGDPSQINNIQRERTDHSRYGRDQIEDKKHTQVGSVQWKAPHIRSEWGELSMRVIDRHAITDPGDEAASDFCRPTRRRKFASHGVLTEVDSSALWGEGMPQ